jgi:hypothetical protein
MNQQTISLEQLHRALLETRAINNEKESEMQKDGED